MEGGAKVLKHPVQIFSSKYDSMLKHYFQKTEYTLSDVTAGKECINHVLKDIIFYVLVAFAVGVKTTHYSKMRMLHS